MTKISEFSVVDGVLYIVVDDGSSFKVDFDHAGTVEPWVMPARGEYLDNYLIFLKYLEKEDGENEKTRVLIKCIGDFINQVEKR